MPARGSVKDREITAGESGAATGSFATLIACRMYPSAGTTPTARSAAPRDPSATEAPVTAPSLTVLALATVSFGACFLTTLVAIALTLPLVNAGPATAVPTEPRTSAIAAMAIVTGIVDLLLRCMGAPC